MEMTELSAVACDFVQLPFRHVDDAADVARLNCQQAEQSVKQTIKQFDEQLSQMHNTVRTEQKLIEK